MAFPVWYSAGFQNPDLVRKTSDSNKILVFSIQHSVYPLKNFVGRNLSQLEKDIEVHLYQINVIRLVFPLFRSSGAVCEDDESNEFGIS